MHDDDFAWCDDATMRFCTHYVEQACCDEKCSCTHVCAAHFDVVCSKEDCQCREFEEVDRG